MVPPRSAASWRWAILRPPLPSDLRWPANPSPLAPLFTRTETPMPSSPVTSTPPPQVGDCLMQIDGKPAYPITDPMSISKRIKGKLGEPVAVRFRRNIVGPDGR